jgi:Arc/MetJ family transcription regulator
MSTNIEIDDDLIAEAMRITGVRTKREAVELGLMTLIALKKQANIRNYRGKLKWDGNLEEMRTSKNLRA